MVHGYVGKVEHNLVLKISQGGGPESFISKVRARNTSFIQPRCRGLFTPVALFGPV